MNFSEIIIKSGSNLSSNELKNRLNQMGIEYDREDTNNIQTLIVLYDEALKNKNNKIKIEKELLADTERRNKNKEDFLEEENSSESELEDDSQYMYIELDGNIIERVEVPKTQKSNLNQNSILNTLKIHYPSSFFQVLDKDNIYSYFISLIN